jgi:hypothetical protein
VSLIGSHFLSHKLQLLLTPDVDAYTNGTQVTFGGNQDDQYSVVLPIGFDFCYFGVNYNRFVIGTNNLITFDTTYAGTNSLRACNS